jgi:hypothetical protein
MILTNRAGMEIGSLSDWRNLAPPAAATHWKPGRSAYELAQLWMEGRGAACVAETLALQPQLAGFQPERAVVEAQTRFDEHRGGPRNHDLLIVGAVGGRRIVVSVEAKADETFGETVAQYQATAQRKLENRVPTKALDRLAGLTRAIAGRDAPTPAILGLRYQLFSATAGALAAARDEGADHAVVFVHEFATAATAAAKQAANEAALHAFLSLLFAAEPTGERWCVGPFRVPGSERISGSTELWFAKTVEKA